VVGLEIGVMGKSLEKMQEALEGKKMWNSMFKP